ncbi:MULTISPECIES: lipocalin family protein [Streptomyces]|uniref:lipocalin family protein n=1 Tax=Streptomyces TaxID=1883 RepID=UPI001C715926|nr:lipocalin family protein [Streptomyces sp. SCUT-3]
MKTEHKSAGAVVAAASLAGAAAAAGVTAAVRSGRRAPVEPAAVAVLDLERYLGTWYQYAAVPRWFEARCAKNARAEYGRAPSGAVSVRNSCVTRAGSVVTAVGEAVPLDAGNARLNVSFLRLPGGFRHRDRANYIVVGLDPDYRWAVVTDRSRNSGFVLSRTPALDPEQRSAVLSAIEAGGLDPRRFRITRQDGGAQERVTLA